MPDWHGSVVSAGTADAMKYWLIMAPQRNGGKRVADAHSVQLADLHGLCLHLAARGTTSAVACKHLFRGIV